MAATNFWIRWRVRTGYPVALVFLIFSRPTVRSLIAGALLCVVGLAIRAWAAGYLRKHEGLMTCGPYAFTRNPLYFGSVILAAGFIIAGDSLLAGIIVVVYLFVFYPAVMKREEEELEKHYGEGFVDYASSVPLFWPRLLAAEKAGESSAQFSMRLYCRNREYQAALGFLIGLALLCVKMRWFERFPHFPS